MKIYEVFFYYFKSFIFLTSQRFLVITSAKEDVLSVFVCLFVINFAQKLPNGVGKNAQVRLAMRRGTADKILVTIRIRVPHPDSDTYPDPYLYPKLLRRFLTEICTVPVLLVIHCFKCKLQHSR